MAQYVNLQDEEFTTHSLGYVAFQHQFYQYHLLANFDYCLKEAVFERRPRLESRNLPFLNQHCVLTFDISPAWWCDVFFLVAEWLEGYDAHRLMYVPSSIVSA